MMNKKFPTSQHVIGGLNRTKGTTQQTDVSFQVLVLVIFAPFCTMFITNIRTY